MTSTMSTPTAAPATTPHAPKGAGGVIALLLVSAFVVILNETIMGVAIPTLMVDLDITAASAQWLTTGFMLTMAVVIPLTGLLSKRFATRTMFIAAMSLFSAGTLLAALAPGFGLLLTGRIIQASGTAIVLPLLMTTALGFVAPHRRGAMMGLISIVISVAPAIGPTASGLVLSALDWRWLFWLVLPIALIALTVGALTIKSVSETSRVRFDALSIALSAVAFGGIIYGLGSFGEGGGSHSAVGPIVALVVGAITLVAFVLRQRSLQRRDAALLDLRPFGTPLFSLATILVFVSMIGMFGTLILLPLYLQNVVGLDTLASGLVLLPGGVLMGLAAPLVGRWYDAVGPRPLLIPGAIVISAALWMFATLGPDSAVVLIVAMHVLFSIGLALTLTPLLTTALGVLPNELYSHGSAIVNTVQQLAGAAGTAVFITVMSTVAAGATGVDAVAAESAGMQAAFMVGGVVSLIAVVLTLFVKPAKVVRAEVPLH
jgi:DHA2 family lincomycin resistance protein-like MFS transporter